MSKSNANDSEGRLSPEKSRRIGYNSVEGTESIHVTRRGTTKRDQSNRMKMRSDVKHHENENDWGTGSFDRVLYRFVLEEVKQRERLHRLFDIFRLEIE